MSRKAIFLFFSFSMEKRTVGCCQHYILPFRMVKVSSCNVSSVLHFSRGTSLIDVALAFGVG